MTDNGDPRQRILGDYQQMKAIGTTFYGVFTGNGAPLGRPFDNTDPIYFQVARNENNACVLATGTLNVGMNIGDRTQITGSVASGGLLQLGSRATITGNVVVNANAFLRHNATVNGNLTLAGVLQHQNIFTITGTLSENTPVTIPSLVTRTITPGTGTQNINPGATVTLNPGQFGNLNIFAGARVTLNPGTYNIAALDVEPDVILTVNSATTLNVQGSLIWTDRVRVQSTAMVFSADRGGRGQDRLFGDGGNDRLTGNTGDDRLEGGDGDDVLDGSGLHGVCIGGAGRDTFLVCETQTQ